MKPISQLILFQEFLGKILQIAFRISNGYASYGDALATGITSNLNRVAQLSCLAVHLETIVEKVLKGSRVKDGIRDGSTAVDDKFATLFGGSSRGIGRQSL